MQLFSLLIKQSVVHLNTLKNNQAFYNTLMHQILSPGGVAPKKSVPKSFLKPSSTTTTSYNMKHQKKQSYFNQSRPNTISNSIQRVSRQINTFNEPQKKNTTQSRKHSNNSSVQDNSWKREISRTEVMCSKSSTQEQNNRLRYLSKRLNQMEIAEHFQGNHSKSIHQKDKMILTDSQKSVPTVRSKSREDIRLSKSKQLDRINESKVYIKESRTPAENKNNMSIISISDNSNMFFLNSKLNQFFDQSIRNSQLFSCKESKTLASHSSIHYYTLNRALSYKKKLCLQPIEKHHPHRSRITSILVGDNSDIYTSSLDYNVFHQDSDSPEFVKLRQHRGGVECLYFWNESLLSGGRDGYIRGDNNQYFNIGSVVNDIQGSESSQRLFVKSVDRLMEVDYSPRGRILRSIQLPKGFVLLPYHDKTLIGTKNQISIYDERIGKSILFLKTPQPINYWQSLNNSIIGVGNSLHIYDDILREPKSKKLPDQQEVISVCQYYSSYLISRKNSSVLLYDTQLKLEVDIEVESNVIFKYSRNRIVCAYQDGRLEYCQIKEEKDAY